MATRAAPASTISRRHAAGSVTISAAASAAIGDGQRPAGRRHGRVRRGVQDRPGGGDRAGRGLADKPERCQRRHSGHGERTEARGRRPPPAAATAGRPRRGRRPPAPPRPIRSWPEPEPSSTAYRPAAMPTATTTSAPPRCLPDRVAGEDRRGDHHQGRDDQRCAGERAVGRLDGARQAAERPGTGDRDSRGTARVGGHADPGDTEAGTAQAEHRDVERRHRGEGQRPACRVRVGGTTSRGNTGWATSNAAKRGPVSPVSCS